MFELGMFAYHYTAAATAIHRILPQMALRMGSLSTLADPREAKTWPFRIYSRSPDSNHLFEPELFSRASRFVTDQSWVLCCTRDDPQVTPDHVDRLLRSGFGHPRMWAQYADTYKGVCLVLKLDELYERIVSTVDPSKLFFGPVRYFNTSDNPDESGAYDLKYLEDLIEYGVEAVLEPHISKHHEALFLTKHLDWRDEWEYRWVLREKRDTPPLIPIYDCIEAVLLGSDCSAAHRDQISSLCESQGIQVLSTLWHGWSLSVFPQAYPGKSRGEVISLNGIAFSTLIPCGGVFTQAFDDDHDVRTVMIDNGGAVIPLAKLPQTRTG